MSSIDAEQLLDELGISSAGRLGGELRFHCPFPEHSHGDKNPSASINVRTLRWNCLGCHRVGNERSLVQELEGLEPFQISRWFDERFGAEQVTPKGSLLAEVESIFAPEQEKRQERALVRLESSVADRYKLHWSSGFQVLASSGFLTKPDKWPAPVRYMVRDRRFSSAILEQHNVGWCGRMQRVTIPVNDEHGCLVGFRGRTIRQDHEPRYLVMQDGYEPYPISKVVWGLDSFKWETRDPVADRLIIVEGELDAIAMRQMGFWNTVAMQGSTVSDEQAKLVVSSCDRAVFFFDSDDAGWKGMLRAADKLETKIKLSTVAKHNFDPAGIMKQAIDMQNDVSLAIDDIVDLLERAIPTTIAALVL